jgi:hypothetical protein
VSAVPIGLCQCGCGQKTRVPLKSNKSMGWTKGEPFRFVWGHTSRIKRDSYRSVSVRVEGKKVRKIREHVLIAERALGKPLPVGAQVHHVDGDCTNNANSNLVICQDQAYHSLLHVRARVVRAGGNPDNELVCSACSAAKPLSEFYTQSANKSHGRAPSCKGCHRAYQKLHKARHKDEVAF